MVLAAEKYPDTPRIGDVLRIAEDSDTCVTFHAGTQINSENMPVTSGGRVLCVTATAPTLREAQALAYAHIEDIRFTGMQYRSDIGYRAVDLI